MGEQVIEEKEPTFEDIQAENEKIQAEQPKEDLTNVENSSNIKQSEEKPPEQNYENTPIPSSWYADGIPSSLKTMSDYHKWYVNMNEMRGKQTNELGAMRNELAELRSKLGQQPQQQEVDIEEIWQSKLAERPVSTIAEITDRIVKAEVEKALGGLRKNYDEKLSKYDSNFQQQEIKNVRADFLEKNKISAEDEAILSDIINKRVDRYLKEFSDDKGNLDIRGLLDDAYDRFKAMKYDDMLNKGKQEEQKKNESRARATVAPGTGKPPSNEMEDFDKMDMEEQEKFIKSKVLRF